MFFLFDFRLAFFCVCLLLYFGYFESNCVAYVSICVVEFSRMYPVVYLFFYVQ